MTPTMFTRTTMVVMIAVALVGAFGAARSGSWDLAGVFVALVALTMLLLLRTSAVRPLVPVRADLVRWLARRSAQSGERPQDLADRAIAAYRSGLVGEEPTDGRIAN
jgi:hypothetical protein